MKKTVLYGIMVVTTIVNLILSGYMAYASFDMMWRQCQCATSGVYWYSIFAYLLFSVVFVIYSFLSSIGYLRPAVYQQVLTLYLISTLVFVLASIRYLKNIDVTTCSCMSSTYRSFLSFMILFRYLGVIAAIIGLSAYAIYIYFSNK